MTQKEIKNLIADKNISRATKALAVLSVCDQPAKISEIRKVGLSVGLRSISKWNLSDIFGKSKYALRVSEGWELLDTGYEHLAEFGIVSVQDDLASVATSSLSKLVANHPSKKVRDFLGEAIGCIQHDFLRASVVLSWSGAVTCIHEYVVRNKLRELNKAGILRFGNNFRKINNEKGFGNLKENDLLQLLEDAGLIDKSTKKNLSHSLDLRNSCAHPTHFIIGRTTAAHHFDVLYKNVFEPFA